MFDVLSVDASVRSRTSYGGTAPERVREQIAAAKEDARPLAGGRAGAIVRSRSAFSRMKPAASRWS